MAENKSPNLHINGLSHEENILSKDQGRTVEVPIGMLGSSTDEEYVLLTPELKLGSKEEDTPCYTSQMFLSSVSGSSDVSRKESYEAVSSSSSSSSDAESGTYDLRTKSYLLGDDVLQPKVIDLEFDNSAMAEEFHIAKEEGKEAEKDDLCEKLLEEVTKYETELNFTKNKLQSSQEEIAKLKFENLTLVEELGGTKEKLRISEANVEKIERKLRHEFEEQQNQFQAELDLAHQSIDHLQAELGSERRLISELQETINKTTYDLTNYRREVEDLKLALHVAQEDFTKEISSLHKQKDELELRNNMFEEQINQYEAEKIESGNRERGLLNEIEQLNKSFDAHKLKYDMLVVERDEGLAKLQTLAAKLNVQETNIQQMEAHISKLTVEHKELLDESEKIKIIVEELRSKVSDKEQEVEKQRGTVYDREEQKREAIRQLCFSLEYYRNGYHELRQAFTKYKKPAVFAA
ncbi:Protein NETWORKED 4B [Bienertia sinuspersici]